MLILKELAQRPTANSSQFKAEEEPKNPRTRLRRMRGTKEDDTGSGMRGLKVFLEGRRSEVPTHPGYCWIIIKTKDLQIEQFVIG